MDEVNKLIHKPLPYIICMIDEFGLCAGLKKFEKLEKAADLNNGGKTRIVNEALELYFAIGGPLEKLYKKD